jgi:hypothetical protein
MSKLKCDAVPTLEREIFQQMSAVEVDVFSHDPEP